MFYFDFDRDVGGQESLRPAWTSAYVTGSSAIVYVIDSSDRERFELSRAELRNLMNAVDAPTAADSPSKPSNGNTALLILANKQDIRGAATAAELSQFLDLTSLRPAGWRVQSCCALTGAGLKEGFDWLSQQMKSSNDTSSVSNSVSVGNTHS